MESECVKPENVQDYHGLQQDVNEKAMSQET